MTAINLKLGYLNSASNIFFLERVICVSLHVISSPFSVGRFGLLLVREDGCVLTIILRFVRVSPVLCRSSFDALESPWLVAS